MSLSTLPQPIKAFLQATASRDRAALLASFVNDAVGCSVDKRKESPNHFERCVRRHTY